MPHHCHTDAAATPGTLPSPQQPTIAHTYKYAHRYVCVCVCVLQDATMVTADDIKYVAFSTEKELPVICLCASEPLYVCLYRCLSLPACLSPSARSASLFSPSPMPIPPSRLPPRSLSLPRSVWVYLPQQVGCWHILVLPEDAVLPPC